MQALQKKQKTWALLLLGALLGLAAFLCLYGTAPLDPANDAWIWYGYDETDIHQHYAGWLGFRNSSWQFPLAQADALAYPAGTGVNISFTDSLPWVSVLFKLLAPVLPAQFQWFGLYELAAFILQGMAAALVLGLFLYDLLPLAAGTALFAFSPIMIERAFRHVALSSHYIVLFALYAYLRGRREQRCFMPVFWLLAALGVGITPYFLPMAAIVAAGGGKRPAHPQTAGPLRAVFGHLRGRVCGGRGAGFAEQRLLRQPGKLRRVLLQFKRAVQPQLRGRVHLVPDSARPAAAVRAI